MLALPPFLQPFLAQGTGRPEHRVARDGVVEEAQRVIRRSLTQAEGLHEQRTDG